MPAWTVEVVERRRGADGGVRVVLARMMLVLAALALQLLACSYATDTTSGEHDDQHALLLAQSDLLGWTQPKGLHTRATLHSKGGWSVDTSIPDECEELTVGNEQLRTLQTPEYPAKYKSNLNCIRVIRAPVGYAVTLKFTGDKFEIEPPFIARSEVEVNPARQYECPSDYLEIRDGKYGFSPLIGRYCGLSFPASGPIKAKSGNMWLYFYSDNLLEYAGFQAVYSFAKIENAVLPAAPPMDCHFTPPGRADGLVQTNVMKAFYKFYANSSRSIECVWKIQADANMQVRIFIERFNLGAPNSCEENFVEIYAGSTAGTPMKRYCGMNAGSLRTGWNSAYIRIFANAKVLPKLDIRALYTAYSTAKNCSELDLFSCGDDTCIPEELRCNGHKNCLYAKDEEKCEKDVEQVPLTLSGTYLIILVIICSLILSLVVCALVLNFCPACKRRQQKYEEILRELARSPDAAAGLNPAGAYPLDRRRHTVPAFMPAAACDGIELLPMTCCAPEAEQQQQQAAMRATVTIPARLDYSSTAGGATPLAANQPQQQPSTLVVNRQQQPQPSTSGPTHHHQHSNNSRTQQPCRQQPQSSSTVLSGVEVTTRPARHPPPQLHRLAHLTRDNNNDSSSAAVPAPARPNVLLMNGMLPQHQHQQQRGQHGDAVVNINLNHHNQQDTTNAGGSPTSARNRKMVTFVAYDEPPMYEAPSHSSTAAAAAAEDAATCSRPRSPLWQHLSSSGLSTPSTSIGMAGSPTGSSAASSSTRPNNNNSNATPKRDYSTSIVTRI